MIQGTMSLPIFWIVRYNVHFLAEEKKRKTLPRATSVNIQEYLDKTSVYTSRTKRELRRNCILILEYFQSVLNWYSWLKKRYIFSTYRT